MLLLSCGSMSWFYVSSLRCHGFVSLLHGVMHARIQRGAGGPDPLKIHKSIGIFCNTGPDPLKKLKATRPAFKVRPTSARQRNAKWRADDGPLKAVFGSGIPHQLKKQLSWTPSDKTFWIRACHGLVCRL